jgi:transitional endoplasmic reticulum ATPase
MIDPALIRSGRFERVLHVPPPDSKAIKEIFSIHSKEMPLGKFNLTDISKKMSGYTGADVESVCREAALTAMRDSKKTVTKSHFETALSMVRPTVTDDMLEYYKKMESLLVSGLTSVKRGKDTQRGMESV